MTLVPAVETAEPLTDQDCLEQFCIVFWCPHCLAGIGTPCAGEQHASRMVLASEWLDREDVEWRVSRGADRWRAPRR